MKTLVILVALSLFASLGTAASAHFATGTTVKLVVEAGTSVCMFDGPFRSNIVVLCFNGLNPTPTQTVVFTLIPLMPGQTGSFGTPGNLITWTLSEPVNGEFDWDVF